MRAGIAVCDSPATLRIDSLLKSVLKQFSHAHM